MLKDPRHEKTRNLHVPCMKIAGIEQGQYEKKATTVSSTMVRRFFLSSNENKFKYLGYKTLRPNKSQNAW